MLSSLISAKAIVALILTVSAVSVAGAAGTGPLGHMFTGTSGSGNLTAAEQAAITYVDTHFSGNGTAKILQIENDTENGSAVFDITILAPNGYVYDLGISQSTNQVISVELSQDMNENQTETENSDNSTSTDNQNINQKDS